MLRGIVIIADFKSHTFKELENGDHVAYRVAKAHPVCGCVEDAEALRNIPIYTALGEADTMMEVAVMVDVLIRARPEAHWVRRNQAKPGCTKKPPR